MKARDTSGAASDPTVEDQDRTSAFWALGLFNNRVGPESVIRPRLHLRDGPAWEEKRGRGPSRRSAGFGWAVMLPAKEMCVTHNHSHVDNDGIDLDQAAILWTYELVEGCIKGVPTGEAFKM